MEAMTTHLELTLTATDIGRLSVIRIEFANRYKIYLVNHFKSILIIHILLFTRIESDKASLKIVNSNAVYKIQTIVNRGNNK